MPFLARGIAFYILLALFPPGAGAAPALLFSDLTSGPATGLGDGKGSGAIVTVWGTNLGSAQGGSTIKIGGVAAAYVYYWKNADGKLPGGPAELYSVQGMQEIAFSIPGSLPNGPTTISVTVNALTSNTLPFTVRSGRLLFVCPTLCGSPGVDDTATGRGSWAAPWATISWGFEHGPSDTFPGDTVYIVGNVSGWAYGARWNGGSENGTASQPISYAAYPGSKVTAVGDLVSGGLGAYPGLTSGGSYWTLSKMTSWGGDSGYLPGTLNRVVGVEATVNPAYVCTTNSMTGFIGVSYAQTELAVFGNYIHDSGCQTSQSQYHTVYISYNDGNYDYLPYEWGWNHFENNNGSTAFQIYTEGNCGGFNGTSSIHDNYIHNQRGVGINISSPGCKVWPTTQWSTFNVYNNVLDNVGLGTQCDLNGSLTINGTFCNYPSLYPAAANFSGPLMQGRATVNFYNNTIYGYGANNNLSPATNPTSAVGVACMMEGLYLRNNIFVNTTPYAYFENPSSQETSCVVWDPAANAYDIPVNGRSNIKASSNNLWYNAGASANAAVPAWDAGPITSNPLFVNAANGFFNLQSGSPAIGAGYNTAPIVAADILGAPRTVPYSIGAFQFQNAAATPPAPPRGFVLK